MSKKVELSTSIKLRSDLMEMNDKYRGDAAIMGKTLMTNPANNSSPRNIMMSSNLDHFMTLTNPEFPASYTNYENMFGRLSSGHTTMDDDYEVYDIIPRYDLPGMQKYKYLMVLWNPQKNHYKVVEKKLVEDLTEVFGYRYKADVMDGFEIGDKIKKNTTIQSTHSYDSEGNFGIGLNARFAYLVDVDTIEDSIKVSESFAERISSSEVEIVKMSLNDNDILLNLYGDDKNYQPFPQIGGMIENGILCAKRRINNRQVLYDLKDENLSKVMYNQDQPQYCSGQLLDIRIYSNKKVDEVPDNRFNHQLKTHLELQTQFYERVKEVLDEILDDPENNVDPDVSFWAAKANKNVSNGIKWKEDNRSVFDNMVIEFVIAREQKASIGQKLTGLFGNKGVVGRICKDDEMPVLETGERLDIVFNALAPINRLSSEPLFELSRSFVMKRTQERLNTIESQEEREELLLKMIHYFNEDQSEQVRDFLKACNKEEYDKFWKHVLEVRINIENKPMWDKTPTFYRLRKIYRECDWIKPYRMYVYDLGRPVRVMNEIISGEMYVIKLKQTSENTMSARATGPVSRKGLPDKTNRHQNNQDIYPKTPLRWGNDELNNASVGVHPELIAKMYMTHRSSIKARSTLGEVLATSTEKPETIEMTDRMVNRNVEILNAFTRYLGFTTRYIRKELHVSIPSEIRQDYRLDDGEVRSMTHDEFIEYSIRQRVIRENNNPKDPNNISILSPEKQAELTNQRVKEVRKELFGL